MNCKVFSYIALGSAISLFSCSKDDNKGENNYSQDVYVETFKGTLDIELDHRSEWILEVGSTPYMYTYTNNSLLSIPEKNPFIIERTYISSSGFIKAANPLVVTYKHPEYFSTLMPTYPLTPDIADQTTSEKLLKADMLYCEYKGKALNNIEGNLVHANALFDLNILEHPDNATFSVTGPVYVTPFDNLNRYKAIMPAYGYNNSAIICMTQGLKQYYVEICGPTNDNYVKPDTHYTFSVRYNSVYDRLEIVDLTESKWDTQNWY